MSSSPPPPAGESGRRRWLEVAAVGLLALTLNLAGNGRIGLWDRDEPRYAGCVREMRARGDWVHPTFNGEPRYQKPILIYWLMRVGVALGGDNPFGARLVSAFAGAGTCLVVWGLGRRMFGPRAGSLAALMLATAPIMVAESKLATIDATLALVLTGCQFCLWELGQRPSKGCAAGFWALLAAATLLKGPVGPALIAVSGLAAWWWGGPSACWTRLRWRWGLAGFVLLTAPWFVAVGVISRGDFFRVAVGEQIFNRVATGMEQHGGFPGYYLVTSLPAFHPWSALLPAALWGAWSRRKAQPAFGFLMGWVVGPWFLLECVRTKIVHYYLPAFPACALLAAWLVGELVREEVNLRRWPLGKLGVSLLGGVGIGLTVLLVAAGVVLPGLRWPSLALAPVIGAGTLFALDRLTSGATERAVHGLLLTWAVTMLGVGAWLAPAAEPYKMAPAVASRLGAHATRHKAEPMLLTFQEPSMVYALGRPVTAVRFWPELFDLLARHEQVVTVALTKEARILLKHPGVDVTLLEDFKGFNLSKGQEQTLHFLLIRPKDDRIATIADPSGQVRVK